MGAGKRVKQFAERFGQGQLVEGKPRFECPQRLTLTCELISRGEHKLGIHLPKEELTSYLGNERCWVKLEIAGRTLIREYSPSSKSEFSIPKELGKIGDEVEVTVNRLGLTEFIATATNRPGSPFRIEADQSGKYHLVIENQKIEMSLAMDMHYEGGLRGFALIFVIRDYLGEKHGMKIAYDRFGDPQIRFKRRIGKAIESGDYKKIVNDYRPTVGMAYNREAGKLEVKYSYKGQTHRAAVWLKQPGFERLDVNISFSEISQSRAEGIVSREAYSELDWSPDKDRDKKGIFGTEIECSTLKKLGINNVNYDASGNNDKRRGVRCHFDVSYLDETGKFVVEEVKLRTSKEGYAGARDEAIRETPDRLKEWNATPNDDRQGLPEVYESGIVVILFDPHTGEFARRLDGLMKIDKDTGESRYFPGEGGA